LNLNTDCQCGYETVSGKVAADGFIHHSLAARIGLLFIGGAGVSAFANSFAEDNWT